jgi:hypothetical protein
MKDYSQGTAMNNYILARCLALILALLFIGTACGPESQAPESGNPTQARLESQQAIQPAWPRNLPADRSQPWETDALANPDDSASRALSALDASSEFTPGAARFNEAGNVVDLGEASRLLSGNVGSGELAWASYRIPMGTQQPGALALDVNLRARSDGSLSEYFIGMSDYGSGRWEWHGPYKDHHVRLAHAAQRGPDVIAGSDYTSTLGNLFVTVLAHNGSALDLLGISSDVRDTADSTAPPIPDGIVASPVAGGLVLQWNDVIAQDLAGYRIYHSVSSFASGQAAGVKSATYIEGSTRHILTGLKGSSFVRIAAIDASGNESGLSDIVSGTPLAGTVPEIVLLLSAPSFLRDEAATLNIIGNTTGLSFDYDLDGDGSFELTDQALGEQLVDTGRAGIIRSRVRASNLDKSVQALGGVSLLVVSNMRPVASGLATPQSGTVPLLVDFDGTASLDFDGNIVGGGWDFDGDGIFDLFDESSPDDLSGQFLYEAPGLYNAKLRVIDDGGAWDVDTLSIFVAEPGANLPPQITRIQASPQTVAPGDNITFSAVTIDPDGVISSFAWDFDNDGGVDSSLPAPSHSFGSTGIFNVRLTVTDDDSSTDTDYVVVLVQEEPIDQAPVVHLQPSDYVQLLGKSTAPLSISLSAGGSYDPEGGSLSYAWDLFGTGSFSGFTPDVNISVQYSFDAPGVYAPAVRVQDEAGNISQASCVVSAYQYSPSVPETGITMAGATSIAALQSTLSPYIGVAYYDSGNDDLLFTRSIDMFGNYWSPPIIVDANGGEWMSLAQGVSQFNMAYYRDGDLFFKASQNDGASFNLSGTVDNTADDAGNFCSCVFYSSSPAVSYYNATDGDLYFCRATNLGSSWGTPVVVDGTGVTGQYTSLTIVNGFPAIAYYRQDTGNLMYVRASNSTGSSWDTPVTVDASANDVGKFASLAVITGADGARPAIAYWDDTSDQVLYRRAADATGAGWGSPVVAMNGVANSLSLRQANGHVFLSAGMDSSTRISFNLSSDEVGSAWGSTTVIESDNAGTLMSASVMPSGLPVLAYYDSSSPKELHVALPRLD